MTTYPSIATITSNGTSAATAGYAVVGGFGHDFGASFGGSTVRGPVTAGLTSPPATASLAGNGIGTATLAGNGVRTAVLAGNGIVTAVATEVLVSAALQLA